ncbi:hydroxycarboxylic acid receptor 3-like [Ascaphus truei]|uniref:hydroxycarboxylic acid receptor 3-like n=1 Tax=Ascaphus truei TaxID=8439 RepID=UPI003F59637B
MYQNTSNDTCCYFNDDILHYLLPPVLIAEFVLGSLGNGVAIWVFCFRIKSWNSSTVYLFNLALADFLLMICLPFRTDYYLRRKTWLYGDVPCRMTLYMLAINRAGSIFFLTVIGVDRYCRVVHPHHQINSTSIKSAVGIACVIWLITIAGVVFILTQYHFTRNMSTSLYCDSFIVCQADSHWHNIFFVVEFFLPLCIILYCSYSIIWKLRQRNLDRQARMRKAVKILTLVGIVFIICFLPSVSSRIEILRLLASPRRNNCGVFSSVNTAFYITVCFTYMNSMCNPVVYYFCSPSFEAFYLQIMRCRRQPVPGSEVEQNKDIDAPSTVQSISQL